MEKIDPEMAAKVWQRVRSENKGESAVGIQTMIAWEKETEAILQNLSKRLPEKGYILQQLLSDTRRHIACLQGIRRLIGEKPGMYAPGKQPMGEMGALLRRCYGQSLRVGAQYAARVEDSQYGGVFSDMARTKRRHCAVVLELLGSI